MLKRLLLYIYLFRSICVVGKPVLVHLSLQCAYNDVWFFNFASPRAASHGLPYWDFGDDCEISRACIFEWIVRTGRMQHLCHRNGCMAWKTAILGVKKAEDIEKLRDC